jgi:hypothetical protein
MLIATVIKGKFKVEVDGALIRVRCNKCGVPNPENLPTDLCPTGKIGIVVGTRAEAIAVLVDARAPNRGTNNAIENLRSRVQDIGFDARRSIILAPVSINGRIEGVHTVICPYCRNAGLINVEQVRISTYNYEVIPKCINTDAREHARRRLFVSYVVLRVLDRLAVTKKISPTAHIVCPGASIQMPGRKAEGYQDAHQVLREITVDGKLLYETVYKDSSFTDIVKKATIFCFGVVSHLESKYNSTDGLVERAITVDFIELCQNIVSGRYRGRFPVDKFYCNYLWGLLCIRYHYACCVARIHALSDKTITEVLDMYCTEAKVVKEAQRPDFVQLDLETLCTMISKDLKV